jgi:hypothetical protein
VLRRLLQFRRANARHRLLRLEKLECRATPAIFPFTVSLPAFHVFEDPDPDPSPFTDDEGDYYAVVKIGNNPEQPSNIINHGETLADANWSFTQNVDTADGNIVTVNIYLMDDDSGSVFDVRGDDDEIDINPSSAELGIVLFVDLTTGTWTSTGGNSAAFPANASTGDDDDEEGAERGRIFFEIDMDSDGLNNRWEIAQGIDVDGMGGVDVPLTGASPARRDLFVEVDAMQNRNPTALPGITGASNSLPIIVDSASHGLTTGTRVTISGVGGNAAANGTFTVTRISDDQFSLDMSDGTSSGFYASNTGQWSLASLAGTGLATNTTLDLAIDTFFRAPVPNPNGTSGINLHVQLDETALPLDRWDDDFDGNQGGPYGEDLNANGVLDPGEDTLAPFGTLNNGDADDTGDGAAFALFVQNFRQNQFGTPAERANAAVITAKAQAYRYAVFADRRVESNGNNLGVSVSSSGRAIAVDYFLVTLGTVNGGTAMQQASTFMHELGHTLILQHGGGDSINNKPNYYSNMNYTWQFADTANANMDLSWKLDYSIGNFPSLTENNLNENNGIGGVPGRFVQVGVGLPPGGGATVPQPYIPQTGAVNWSNNNFDGVGTATDDVGVSADINFDGVISTMPFTDYNDWANIGYGISANRARFTSIFGSGAHQTEFTLDTWMDRNRMLFFRTPYANGADDVTLRLNGGLLELVSGGSVVASRPLAETGLIVIIGADNEDDRLTIDFAGGNPIPAMGLRFAGGAGSGTDRLVLAGSPPAPPQYTPDATGAPENGTLQMGGSAVSFTGLEFVSPVAPRVAVAVLNPTTLDENQSTTLNVDFLDAGSQSTHSVRIDWGDGTPTETFPLPLGVRSFSRVHQFKDDNPTATPFDINSVAITITDNDLLAGSSTPTIRVNNVAPRLMNVTVTPEIDEDGVVTLSGQIIDPGTLDTFTLVVNWGEGPTQAFTYPAGTTQFSETHQYLDDNPTNTSQDIYTIGLSLSDDDTGTATDSLQTLVRNVAPVVTDFTSDAVECGDKAEGDTVHVIGSFIDIGTLDTHTAVIDWGDNSPPTPATVVESSGSGTISGSHVYSSGGIFRIVVTLTDDDTGQTTDRTFALITGVGILDGQLQVVGTKGADDVLINLMGNGTFQAHATFIKDSPRSLPAAGVTSIAMILCEGDDRAAVSGNIFLPTYIAGEEGDDVLNGGSGPNVLLGGAGDDDIRGGSGHDILVGGIGADRIVGNQGRDILIAGELEGQADPIDQLDHLLSLLAEWAFYTDPSRTRTRLAVIGDDDADTLTGSSDADWFFFELGEDDATDVKSELRDAVG